MSDDRQVFHTPSRDEYRQYTALVRDLEVRAALDTSQLANVPRFGQAGPSDWQGEGELSSASSQATAPTRKRRRDTRWPAPRHKLQDTLFNVPNYLHEALEAYATSRIYLHGLVYPTDSDDPVDIQHLLETQLPPGVEDETMRVLNATLQDLAALRPATYKNERADQEDMPWETILHVAGPHCSPNAIKRVIERLRTETSSELSIPQRRLDILATSRVPPPAFNDLLAAVLPGCFDTPKRKRR